MKKARYVVKGVLVGLILSAGFCAAGPFEKEFKLKNVVGTCTVTLPDGATDAAQEGKAYPYGCTIKTGRKSSAVMELSGGNEVRILANSALQADQTAEDASDKTVRLREGRIQVKLEETFHKSNKFKVETPAAVCGAIGCEFTATASPTSCSFDIQEGAVIASGVGPYAQWSTQMDSGDKISVGTAGKTITTISNNGGQFVLKYKGAGGEEHPIELSIGSKVNLTAQQGVDERGRPVVKLTIVVTDPEGRQQTIETFVNLPEGTPPPPPPSAQGGTLLQVQTTGTTPTPVGAPGP